MTRSPSTVFCTIVTKSHLDYALALYFSYRQYAPEVPFYVLVSDEHSEDKKLWGQLPDFNVLNLSELREKDSIDAIATKYQSEPDFMRWSLKPAMMIHLMQDTGFEEVVFLDCDLCFYGDISAIRNQLADSTVLLSPHWRSNNPHKDPDNFRLNFTDGLFNGGFVGATKAGIDALEWWMNACLYRCERTREEGFYVDQKYLDLLPAQFEGTQILYHRGCNVANWNLGQNLRSQDDNGEIKILGKWPIIFIHFSGSTVRGILKKEDPLLLGHFEKWQAWLNQAAELLGRPKRVFAAAPKALPLQDRIMNKLGMKVKSK